MVIPATATREHLSLPEMYYADIHLEAARLLPENFPNPPSDGARDDDKFPPQGPKGADAGTVAAKAKSSHGSKIPKLAPAIAVVLNDQEAHFCQHNQYSNCQETFLKGIRYREVALSPSGQNGLIVELSAPGFCGSGGCGIYVLAKTAAGYKVVLDEKGSLDQFKVETSTTGGYYELTQLGTILFTRFSWTGSKYIPAAIAFTVTDLPGTSGRQSFWPSARPLISALAGLLLCGLLAWALYGIFAKHKCAGCGKTTKARGDYCPACAEAGEDPVKRNPAQRTAAEQAREDRQAGGGERERKQDKHASTLKDLRRLTGREFEDLISSLFRKDGYTVFPYNGHGNEETDLVLFMGETKDVAQCRRWKLDIGAAAARAFYGTFENGSVRHGFMITTALIGPGVREFVQDKPISLISGPELLSWINGTYSSRDQPAASAAEQRDRYQPNGTFWQASYFQLRTRGG